MRADSKGVATSAVLATQCEYDPSERDREGSLKRTGSGFALSVCLCACLSLSLSLLSNVFEKHALFRGRVCL